MESQPRIAFVESSTPSKPHHIRDSAPLKTKIAFLSITIIGLGLGIVTSVASWSPEDAGNSSTLWILVCSLVGMCLIVAADIALFVLSPTQSQEWTSGVLALGMMLLCTSSPHPATMYLPCISYVVGLQTSSVSVRFQNNKRLVLHVPVAVLLAIPSYVVHIVVHQNGSLTWSEYCNYGFSFGAQILLTLAMLFNPSGSRRVSIKYEHHKIEEERPSKEVSPTALIRPDDKLERSGASDESDRVYSQPTSPHCATPMGSNDGGSTDFLTTSFKKSFLKAPKYKAGAEIGHGAHSTVRIALNESNGELMAMKTMKFDPQDKALIPKLDAFQNELITLRKLRHTNVVQYLFMERCKDHTINIFMEYVPGGSLLQCLQQFGAFSHSILITYLKQIVQGLQYIHAQGVVHGDLKAANILLTVDGLCKLTDFGGEGTFLWMSPERILKLMGQETGEDTTSLNHRISADMWALGCLIMEMCTAKLPFAHLNLSVKGVLMHVLGGDDDSNSTFPAAAHTVFDRGLFLEYLKTEIKYTATEAQLDQLLTLLEKCLQRDPMKRPTCSELLSGEGSLSDTTLSDLDSDDDGNTGTSSLQRDMSGSGSWRRNTLMKIEAHRRSIMKLT
eukprot:PhF_6_TR4858/c0_g1_i1/m.6809